MPKNRKPQMVHPGEQYNDLYVLGFSHSDKRWRRHYLCLCVCGKKKTVQGSLLRSGNTKSCGCRSKEAARKRTLPHGVASLRQVVAGYKHKAKNNNVLFSLTILQFKVIASSSCFYCGAIETNTHRSPHGTGDFTYNGLDRIDARKGYTINNVVSCCKQCNFSKSNRSQGDFIQWIRRAYKHLLKNTMAEQWG